MGNSQIFFKIGVFCSKSIPGPYPFILCHVIENTYFKFYFILFFKGSSINHQGEGPAFGSKGSHKRRVWISYGR